MTGPGASVTPVVLPPGFDPLTLHRVLPARYPVLLESVARGTPQGRYDMLLAFPGDALRADGASASGFLERLDREFLAGAVGRQAGLPVPFHGGWFLFLGYELRAATEPTAGRRPAPRGPVALALRIPAALVRDHERNAAWIVTEPGHGAAAADIARDIASAPPGSWPTGTGPLADELTEAPPAAFLAAVGTVRARIAAGDLYQANLARRWHGRLRAGTTLADVYARLRRTNPAPFAGLAQWQDLALASSSPERLVRVTGERIETRPIAGTRPVAGSPAVLRRRELLDNPKERAEHVMLIDLERNDLGRVCRPGTVSVPEFMVVESYTHVHHIVSAVTGMLLPGTTPGAVLRAVFPGGTITGCPKVRCMTTIDELEGTGRGAYTGSMGYLNRDGSMDLNILIRTIEVAGREFSFAAGSGIVADSDPRHELEETRAKALGMVLAMTGP